GCPSLFHCFPDQVMRRSPGERFRSYPLELGYDLGYHARGPAGKSLIGRLQVNRPGYSLLDVRDGKGSKKSGMGPNSGRHHMKRYIRPRARLHKVFELCSHCRLVAYLAIQYRLIDNRNQGGRFRLLEYTFTVNSREHVALDLVSIF